MQKATKRILAYTLTLAILISTLVIGTVVSGNTDETTMVPVVDVWEGEKAESFARGNGTAAEPFEIETPEQLYKMLMEYSTVTASKGVYFEIKNDIYLNDVADGTHVKDLAKKENWLKEYGTSALPNGSSTNAFCGTLDGNGHTIYGLYTSGAGRSGLFHTIVNGATIKNLSMDNVYLTDGKGYGGALVGRAIYIKSNPASEIKNCSVTNAEIGGDMELAGGLVGHTSDGSINFTNCYSYNLTLSNWESSGTPGGITGGAWSGGTVKMTNCYTVGYFVSNSKVNKTVCTNVYTNVAVPSGNTTAGVIVLTDAQMKSEAAKANMAGFNFDVIWKTVANGYPVFNDIDVWDGTKAESFAGGNGTAAEPFEIKTPEQLYKMLMEYSTVTASKGVYFEIKNDIYLNDVADGTHVKDLAKKENWLKEYDTSALPNGSSTNAFCGTLDGNGHTIYGLYTSGAGRSGLFHTIVNGATIKNLSMDNVYLTDGKGYGGALVGRAIYIKSNPASEIKNCSVTNAEIGGDMELAGGLIGHTSDGSINFTNCYSYNLTLSNWEKSGVPGGITGGAWDGGTVKMTNCYTVGYFVSNSKVNKTVCTNVYTNVAVPSGNTTAGVTVLTDDQMKDEAAKANMAGFDFGGVWKTVENGYPVLREEIIEVWDHSEVTSLDAFKGNGTEESPYLIENGSQLAYMLKTNGGYHFKLVKDIRLNDTSKADWQATAHDWVWNNFRFVGTFDGDGHTIDGLFYDEAKDKFGLFSYVGDSLIKNFKITNAYVDNGGANGVAIVVGQTSADTVFENIYIDETCVLNAPKASGVAGITAHAYKDGSNYSDVTIKNCAVLATITGKEYTGALIGRYAYGNEIVTIDTSYSASNVSLTAGREYQTTTTNYATVADEVGTVCVAADDMKGENAKANMSALNYNQVWKTVDGSYPVQYAPSYSAKYWNGTAAGEFADGTGTEADPYLISNASELYLLATLDRETTLGNYYKLTNDIEISNVYDNWANDNPYTWAVKKAYLDGFTYTDSFAGILDGAGYTVSGLYYKDDIADGGTYAYGLIPFVTADAIIKNITVTDVNATVTGEGAYVGAVAGAAHVMDEDLANPFHMVQFVGVNAENVQISANSKGDILGGASHGVKFELSNAQNIIGNYISHVGIRNCNNGSTYSDDVIIYNTFNIDENTVTNIKNVLLGTSSDYITTINADDKFDIADLVAADEAFSAAAPEEYLVWSQEFNSNQLNTSVWTKSTTAMSKGTTLEYADTATFDGESISLNCLDSKKKDSNGDVIYNINHALTTFDSMSYKYGRLEMRAKIPFGAGAFPSLWLSSRGAMGYDKMCEYSTEIDVFEVFGKTADANRLEACIHKWYNKDGVKTNEECSCGAGYGKGNGYEIDVENRSQIIEKTAQDEFHTIVFDWTEDTMTFSVDGKVYYTATKSEMDNASQSILGFGEVTGFDITGYKTSNDGIFNQYLSLLLTNSMYTAGEGAAYDYQGNASEIVPENLSFEIDYIRLYQKNDGISKINLK